MQTLYLCGYNNLERHHDFSWYFTSWCSVVDFVTVSNECANLYPFKLVVKINKNQLISWINQETAWFHSVNFFLTNCIKIFLIFYHTLCILNIAFSKSVNSDLLFSSQYSQCTTLSIVTAMYLILWYSFYINITYIIVSIHNTYVIVINWLKLKLN